MKPVDQGVDRNRYKVIVRTLIFVFSGNEVLLLQGAKTKKIWPGKYNGIGGHVEEGEDVLSSARRELFEETGLSGLPLVLCGTIVITIPDNPGILLFVYRSDSPSRIVKSGTEGELHWVSMDQLDSLDLVDDIKIILPKVAENYGSLFSGRYWFEDGDLKIEFSE